MAIVDFSEVIKLKNAVNSEFGEKVHFHDACGGQYFTLEKNNPEMVEFIKLMCKNLAIRLILMSMDYRLLWKIKPVKI